MDLVTYDKKCFLRKTQLNLLNEQSSRVKALLVDASCPLSLLAPKLGHYLLCKHKKLNVSSKLPFQNAGFFTATLSTLVRKKSSFVTFSKDLERQGVYYYFPPLSIVALSPTSKASPVHEQDRNETLSMQREGCKVSCYKACHSVQFPLHWLAGKQNEEIIGKGRRRTIWNITEWISQTLFSGRNNMRTNKETVSGVSRK